MSHPASPTIAVRGPLLPTFAVRGPLLPTFAVRGPLLPVLAGLLLVGLAHADLWVAETGSDERGQGDGSQERPFRTIGKALEACAEAGTVWVLPGKYREFNIGKKQCAGLVTIKAVEERKAIIDRRAFPTAPGHYGIVAFNMTAGVRDVTVDGLVISDWGQNIRLFRENSENISFVNCESRNSWAYGLKADGGRNLRVIGCDFHHNRLEGCVLGDKETSNAEDFVIQDCRAWSNGQTPYPDPETGETKIARAGADGFCIELRPNADVPEGGLYARGVIVNCRAWDNSDAGFDIKGYTDLTGCTAVDNRDGIKAWRGSVNVDGCYLVGNKNCGINLADMSAYQHVNTNRFTHTTFAANAAGNIVANPPDLSQVTVSHCILYGRTVLAKDTRWQGDHNLYWQPTEGAAVLRVGETEYTNATAAEALKEADAVVADPRFADPAAGDYSLAPNSPALTAGADGMPLGPPDPYEPPR